MKTILKNISWKAMRVWQRNFDVYLNTWKINFIPPLFEPIFYLATFGVGMENIIENFKYNGQEISYMKFIAPGLIAYTIMNHSFFETTYASYVRMYYQKTFDAILSTPLIIEDVILGELLWGTTKSIFAGLIMFVITLFLGIYSLPLVLLFLPVTFIAGMAFSGLGMCFTSIVKSIEMFSLPVFLFITPMFLLSGVFFPLSALPQWMQKIALAMPLTLLVSTLRELSVGHLSSKIFFDIFILALIGLFSSLLSIFLMKKRLLK